MASEKPVLDKCCSSAHIAKISEHIGNWQELAPYFGLTEAEEQEILNSHAHQYKVQKRKMVWKWVRKQGDRATYRELKRVFEEAGESLLVSRVDELLQDDYSQAPHNIVNSFREYLKDCYGGNSATYQGQKDWPPQLSQSPFMKPELVLKRMPQSIVVSNYSSNQQEIKIGDLCKLGKKVMLEGTAGSGKTTLTRHICQQWAEGKLFHDVNLLIHLTLADPALWSAKSLEDIIPHPSAEMRKTVADHIMEQGGKRCCFILDGWEDLPKGSSFIHKILEGIQQREAALPHCLFIVTSRPFTSASLQPLVSTTVEITGFSHESVDVTVVLDKRCSSAHVAKISEHIENWQELAPYFGLTEAEEQEILNNHAHQYKVQKRKMVWKWVRKWGDRATYRELRSVFEEAGESLLVSGVDELLQNAYSQAPHNVVNSFREYLKDCYGGNPATYQGQKDWPPHLSQSPFMKPELVLKLNPQSVAVSNHSSNQQEIKIGDLCKLGKKVMLEGTAGSGKTTLTRHICQQWAEGKLFHDVNLLIHLTLAEPALWSAKSLEDIIPHPSAEMRKTVADHIMEQGGKRCCFILDGWEDLPEGSSFIHKTFEGIQPREAALPHCLFVVTSRPFASAFLQPLVSTTLEITGFSHESVDTYATQYLTQIGRDPTVFIMALNSNHHARGLCSLPINAVILLHLFLTIQTGLPTTQTELFKCFILNLLLRHLMTKVGHKCRSLREFSDLPLKEKGAFNNLCRIAHHSIFSGKASSQSNQLLSSDDLQKAGLHDIEGTLGLMKVHQQLTWCGYDPHYGFLHSSVQDFLCAVRMSQLSSEEQVRNFTHIVNTNPTSLVLHFYAGLTKLENKSVCQLLCVLGREASGPDCIDQVYAARCAGGDPRRLFLTYLHCLFEANMTSVLVQPKKLKLARSYPLHVAIIYQFYRLTIHDLNVISYYILNITRLSHPASTMLYLSGCFIDDHGIETLVANITKQAQSYQSTCTLNGSLALAVYHLNIPYERTYTHRGVKALANLITMKNVPLDELWIQCGDFSSLRALIEAFSSPTAVNCCALSIPHSDLTSRHVYHLILLLTQARYLRKLDVIGNPGLHEAVPLLLSAARNLKEIIFSDIPIDDQELLEMAQVLQSNTSLIYLNIESPSETRYTFVSLIKFVEIVTAPESKSQLEELLFGQYEEDKNITSLSKQLTRMAASRGHKLVVIPVYLLSGYTEVFNLGRKQFVEADRIPNPLLFGNM